MTFEWDSAPKVLAISPCKPEAPTKPEPEVTEPAVQPARLPASAPRGPLLRDTVEQYLTERKIPYVDVNEAKRALFASAKLGSFHFVAYNKNPGPNWLIWAAHLRRQSRLDMAEWEKVFGEGFVAVVAKEKPGGELAFKTLAGDSVDIT